MSIELQGDRRTTSENPLFRIPGEGSMPTRVFLVRHGATAHGRGPLRGRDGRDALGRGPRAAPSPRGRLAAKPLAAVCASPMTRTFETRRILAAPHGLAVEPRRRPPRDLPRALGRIRGRRSRRSARGVRRVGGGPVHFAPEGGETGLAVTARALPACRIVTRARGRSPVVSHKATIRLAALLAPRVRSATLPRPPRPEPRVPERPRLPGPLAGPAHALQRRLAYTSTQAPRRPRSRRAGSPSGGNEPPI